MNNKDIVYMKSIRSIVLLLLTVIVVGCEVDFSPNAKWKETPVVYCVLDQDDDTSWVRVEKCFLGEGSIYQYGSVSDSINYPKDSILVQMLEYRNGALQQTISLQYTVRQREDGEFPAIAQPIYYTDTPLDERCMYKLEVHRTSDGSLLASTDSIPLIIKDPDMALFTSPGPYDRFKFMGNSSGGPSCTLEWNQLANARRYQPFIRFYYKENGEMCHLDLMCDVVNSGNLSSRLGTSYPRQTFLNEIKSALQNDTATKYFVKSVDLYLTACDENLNVYINSVTSGTSIDQTTDVYTNIHGGVGIFGARRTHLFRTVDADSSLAPPDGLHYLLKSLDVGFE